MSDSHRHAGEAGARRRWPGMVRTVALAALVSVVAAEAVVVAQNVPRMRKLTVASQSFSIDYPDKDWSLVPGGSVTLLSVAQKRFEAVLLV